MDISRRLDEFGLTECTACGKWAWRVQDRFLWVTLGSPEDGNGGEGRPLQLLLITCEHCGNTLTFDYRIFSGGPSEVPSKPAMIDGPDVREPYGRERVSKVSPFLHPKARKAGERIFGPPDRDDSTGV